MIVSVAKESRNLNSPFELAGELECYVRQSAADGCPLHEVEREIFDRVLRMGFVATDELLKRQGDGDLGQTIATENEQTLYRSDEPVQRRLRTVFGEHRFEAFVYARGEHEKIALRPVDARLELPQGCVSYLYEEFSQ